MPSQEVFGAPKGLLRRCLGVQTPTHKVFGRLGIDLSLPTFNGSVNILRLSYGPYPIGSMYGIFTYVWLIFKGKM